MELFVFSAAISALSQLRIQLIEVLAGLIDNGASYGSPVKLVSGAKVLIGTVRIARFLGLVRLQAR